MKVKIVRGSIRWGGKKCLPGTEIEISGEEYRRLKQQVEIVPTFVEYPTPEPEPSEPETSEPDIAGMFESEITEPEVSEPEIITEPEPVKTPVEAVKAKTETKKVNITNHKKGAKK